MPPSGVPALSEWAAKEQAGTLTLDGIRLQDTPARAGNTSADQQVDMDTETPAQDRLELGPIGRMHAIDAIADSNFTARMQPMVIDCQGAPVIPPAPASPVGAASTGTPPSESEMPGTPPLPPPPGSILSDGDASMPTATSTPKEPVSIIQDGADNLTNRVENETELMAADTAPNSQVSDGIGGVEPLNKVITAGGGSAGENSGASAESSATASAGSTTASSDRSGSLGRVIFSSRKPKKVKPVMDFNVTDQDLQNPIQDESSADSVGAMIQEFDDFCANGNPAN